MSLEALAESWYLLTLDAFEYLAAEEPWALLLGAKDLTQRGRTNKYSLSRLHNRRSLADFARAVECSDVDELIFLGRSLLPSGAWVRKSLRQSTSPAARAYRYTFERLFRRYQEDFRRVVHWAAFTFALEKALPTAFRDDLIGQAWYVGFRALDAWHPHQDSSATHFLKVSISNALLSNERYVTFTCQSHQRRKDFISVDDFVPGTDELRFGELISFYQFVCQEDWPTAHFRLLEELLDLKELMAKLVQTEAVTVRDLNIFLAFLFGPDNLSTLARRYGLTRQRVHQIVSLVSGLLARLAQKKTVRRRARGTRQKGGERRESVQ